jgi:hypothetical protein
MGIGGTRKDTKLFEYMFVGIYKGWLVREGSGVMDG